MSWDAMVTAEANVDRIIQDHAAQIGHIENAAFENARLSFGVSYRQGHRKGFKSGVAWVLHMQAEFSKLPPAEQIAEFDKGEASLYWPLLKGDEL